MQEDIEQRTISVTVQATKLSGRVLRAAIAAVLQKIEQERTMPKVGRNSMKRLTARDPGANTIEVTGRMPDHYDPSVRRAWERELSRLETEYQAELARFKPIREEQRKVSHIRYCVDRVLQTRTHSEQAQPKRSSEQER